MAENPRSCPACGTNNEEDARFCDGCGGSLARICGTCGVEARAEARFCRGCGGSLDASDGAPPVVAAGPVRKTVTVMFADLAGSTSFEERVDAETAREVIGRYHDLLRSTAQRHRAGVTKYIGDGFMAVWGVPETGLDDAGHAVEAGVELQERFVELASRVAEAHDVELALRVAVNTGEVVIGEGDADIVGDALNVAARLEAECPHGHVVVGEETWRSTRGQHRYDALGQVQVKGRTTPVAVFQWLGRHAESSDAAPFIGRADEVQRLQAALGDATRARAARMVTVIGDPGVGKTRLAAELVVAHPGLRVVRTRCNVEETVAMAPIVELLRSRDLDADVPVGTPERDRMLRDLKGLADGVPGSVEETFWALRRFVEALALDGPLLIVLDDIQWADALLLDFVEHLVEWVSQVPVLVLGLARPELREVRADFVAVSRWVTQAVHLDGLDAGATAELAAEVLGGARLPEELLGRLPSSTGGNPLFVRELIGMLVDDEVLVLEPTGWRLTIDVDAITIPPTIHALLASRLERLDAADRRVLEIASVLGTDFSLGAVAVLAERSAAAIKPSLDRLRRLQLAQPSGAYVGDEPVWRFHHVLIRDVAYRRLLKSDRAELHVRFADWVDAGGATLASDPDEMVARHLESAHGYRLDLGTLDGRAGDLALRSARCYLASARRALDRDELAAAGSQAARGAALATSDDAVRAELLLIGCEAYLSAGDVVTCAPLVDDLERVAGEMLSPWATCYRCQFIVYTDPERLLEVDGRLQDAIDEFGRRNDSAGLAKAHRVRARARASLGRIGDCESDLLEALIAARRSGDQRQITAALSAAPSAALWGPSPVPKAGGRCLDVVRMQRMATAAPSLEATSLRHLAVLELLRGRPDKARSMLADARQVVADLGLRHGLMETELFAGIIESMVGDPAAAEPHFRTALDGLDALGVGADAGLAAALLARSVLAQGRVDDADRYAGESQRLAGHNLKTAIAWRAVRAEILCAQGNFDDAAALAREAILVAAGTDLVLDHADACLALGRVLAAAGDARGADGARRDADALYAAKEVVSPIGRTVEPAAPAAPAAPAPATKTSRLAVVNRASEVTSAVMAALQAHDVDAAMRCFSDDHIVDERRRWLGNPIPDFRTGLVRVLEQFSHLDWRTLAVRGERLHLCASQWSDDSGNESTYLHMFELGQDGRIGFEARFDDDDFESAYRELERRYYDGEGAAFARHGAVASAYMTAVSLGDFDKVFGELTSPGFEATSRSRSVFGDRSAAEVRASFEELSTMVSSARTWFSAICWLSPTSAVSRFEREAVGMDGEQYSWTQLHVAELFDGRLTSICQFDSDEEGAAFAYAAERTRSTTSRLPVTNRASDTWPAAVTAMRAHDIDGAVAFFSDDFAYDDRRRLRGNPIGDLHLAFERIFEQYNHFEWRTLAVRGELLHLLWSRWSDDSGNETTHLHVHELGDDGRIGIEVRFDEDDFEGAYRELERRYYAGEGLAFARHGHVLTEWLAAMDRLDVEVARSLAQPEFRWLTVPSALSSTEHTVDDLFRWLQARGHQVSSVRHRISAVRWLSPDCCVAVGDATAIGLDGEDFEWTRLYVGEYRDGLLASVRQFELDDEDAAFAYAEERVLATTSRLARTNRASEVTSAQMAAMRAFDVDGAVGFFSNGFSYDDRRRLGGKPIGDMRTVVERILAQYSHFEWRTLVVRGELLHLFWSRWSDDSGNESTHLPLRALGDDGRVEYEGRFDEDDFEGAYRELERRYYTGEGLAFAAGGAVAAEVMAAYRDGDFDRAFSLFAPDFVSKNQSRNVFGDRSAAQLRASNEELSPMVASTRGWLSVIRWLSPTCLVGYFEREAVGLDAQHYAWTRLAVAEIRDGLVTSMCQFEPGAEEAAFAYAEERVRATASRLARTNRASEMTDRVIRAMAAHDIDAAAAHLSEGYSFDDRRAWSRGPFQGVAVWRAAASGVLEQYSHFEGPVLAVRGERLALIRCRWSDEAGNETVQLQLYELGAEGRITQESYFDEDDFEGAYRELDRRYYAGEGAEFAVGGAVPTEWMMALNRGDFDRTFGELSIPEFRLESRSRSVLGDRSAAELRASVEELSAMVASARGWLSAICWLSPTHFVCYFEREAEGLDGEKYTWTRLGVVEVRNGRVASMCEFDPDDEDDAFAYAEEKVRATSRLALTNWATKTWDRVGSAMQTHDVDAISKCYSDRFVYDDRRGLSGDPIEGAAALTAAAKRVHDQYAHFEGRVLAIRGERLVLGRTRWSDEAGNETVQFHVEEMGDDGRITCEVRFDGHDFERAYRELERRYYAGEGAAFAAGGAASTEWIIALNRNDFDRIMRELAVPGFRLESRSNSVFGDRSAPEWRSSVEELSAIVASSRQWVSAIHWLSPTCTVSLFEREAVGLDGEQYSWTWFHVTEVRDGRLMGMCEFDPGEKEEAFAYAEEKVRATASRLTATNRASTTWDRLVAGFAAHDVDTIVGTYSSDPFAYDDRRALSGDPIHGVAAWRTAVERVLDQYSHFEGRTLAVRGERLALARSRWSDGGGNETVQLHVLEVADDERIIHEGRFDEHDFESAYRELDRRYYAGEGAAFAASGAVSTEWMIALSRGDFDRIVTELAVPGFRMESRSSSVFGDRSAPEWLASVKELSAMVTSSREWLSAVHWLSPTCVVFRFEREAVGLDREQYAWTRLGVVGIHGGRLTWACDFDAGDEDEAFACAEQRVAARPSRLAVANLATERERRLSDLIGRPEFDSAALDFMHEHFRIVDRRAMSGAPFVGRETGLVNLRRFLADYPHVEIVPLAVRGDRLALVEYHGRTPDAYEVTYLNVNEVNDVGQLMEQVRFDGDDFEGAYRELEKRYYSGEGAPFAEVGALQTEFTIATNRGDLDKAYGEFTAPDFRFTSRSRSVFGDRTAQEVRAAAEELAAMVVSVRMWFSAVHWLSPTRSVDRMEREAVGLDGEKYAWSRLNVSEVRDGVLTSICEFDVDDEESAFAYAESLVSARPSRLAVTNPGTETQRQWFQLAARDGFESAPPPLINEQFQVIDRRAMPAAPCIGREAGIAGLRRLLADYPVIDAVTLAVRGQSLALIEWRCRTPSGFEATYLNVHEFDDAGVVVEQVRFDGDDFEGAYRELEERYYAGEGAAFAAGGALQADYVIAMNRGDFDRLFGELVAPDFRLTSRARSAFGDRSAAEYRASVEELAAMVSSARTWFSATCWLSQTCAVSRFEREAVGLDGEHYAWTRLTAWTARGGLLTSACEFELEDEEEAFAYAEECMRAERGPTTSTDE